MKPTEFDQLVAELKARSAPPDAWAAVFRGRSEDDHMVLATYADVAWPSVAWLLRDPRPSVRSSLALRGDLPADAVEALAAAAEPNVRTSVAQRRDLTPSLVERLVKDPDPSVRAFTSLRRDLSPAQYDALARDPDVGVRQAAASNSRFALAPPDSGEESEIL